MASENSGDSGSERISNSEIQGMLRDLAAWLSVCPDLDTAGEDILSQIVWLDGIDEGILYLSMPDGSLEAIAKYPTSKGFDKRSLHFDSGSELAWLTSEKDVVFVDGAKAGEFGFDGAPLSQMAVFALTYGGEVEAVLVIGSTSPRPIPEQSLNAVESVCALTSGVIARLLAKEALEESEKELLRHRDSLEVLVSERTDELQRAIESLEHEVAVRKRAQRDLVESEARLKQTQSLALIGGWEWRPKEKAFWVSEELHRITGLPEGTIPADSLPGLVESVVHPEDRQIIFEQIGQLEAGKLPEEVQFRIISKDEEIRNILGSVPQVVTRDEEEKPEVVVGVMQDITERERAALERSKLERQLEQSHKMQAIGTLAGGIAHDFNNILFGAMAFTDMALDQVKKGDKIHTYLEQVMSAQQRAAELVMQILMFSRPSERKKISIHLKNVIEDAVKLLRGTLPSTIDINQRFEPDCGPVMADTSRIHQVLMNLCTNAFFAMKETGGVLRIHLERVEVNDDLSSAFIDLDPGEYTCLVISDTGSGMTEEVQKRIFEPYFTTKKVGEGSGIGVSTVHANGWDHGGAIHVYSESKVGTVFRVFFPVAVAERDDKVRKSSSIPRGSESVLFVDDEEQIVLFAKMALEELGYDIHTYTSSIEAFETFAKNPKKFDVVVTDQTMPTMTGGELVTKMLEIRSDIPIVLCTGFSEIMDEKIARSLGVREFISKPILLRDLVAAIRRALNPNLYPSEE